MDKFVKCGANQNIDPDYVEMVGGLHPNFLNDCKESKIFKGKLPDSAATSLKSTHYPEG